MKTSELLKAIDKAFEEKLEEKTGWAVMRSRLPTA